METTLTDNKIKEKAKSAEWERFVFTLSGKARRVALVFNRGYEDVEFRTTEKDAEELGRRIAENWLRAKRPEEEDLIFVRAVELGEPKSEHVLIRLPVSGDHEMFRCVRCMRMIPGRFNPLPRVGDLPYSVIAPSWGTGDKFNRKEYEDRERFWRQCRPSSNG